MGNNVEIRQIDIEHAACTAEVICLSFRTVANEFGLTPENCPTHPAFLTAARLRVQMADGLQLFGCYTSDALVGVIGIKKRTCCEFEIERLAVLPKYRHKHYGTRLMMFACELILRDGGETVHLSIIDENAVLKKWYQQQGFLVIEMKQFPQLPFTVCFMQKVLKHTTNSRAYQKDNPTEKE